MLGIQGRDFTINGTPTFLTGFSYYSAIGGTVEAAKNDITWMKSKGFNWFRLWPLWNRCSQNASVMDLYYRWIPDNQSKMLQIIDWCDKHGVVVDITGNLCRCDYWQCCNDPSRTCDQPHQPDCPAPTEICRTVGGLQSFWEQMTTLLKPYRNLYFDIGNEHDVMDMRWLSREDVRVIRDAIKAIDPARIVTCSGGDTSAISQEGLDFFAPHLDRSDAPWLYTCEWLQANQLSVPIMLQEPFRNGYGGQEFNRNHFCYDVRCARQKGAAGWCFHTDAGFNLDKQAFQPRLDDQERLFIDMIGGCK